MKALVYAAHVWQDQLQRAFPDVPDAMVDSSDPMQSLVELAFRRCGPACPVEPDQPGCCGSLLVDNAHRCPCVAARTRRLPLCLGSLVKRRSGSSALSGGGFSALLATLRRHFVFDHRELETLQDDTLAPLDVLIVCTTEGPALSASELAALRAWVENGGALIASAFANWSAFGHFSAETVAWLGLETIPHTAFLERRTHDLIAPETVRKLSSMRMLLTGPFGKPVKFVNTGESSFRILGDAIRFGAVQLTEHSEDDLATLVFYPPRSVAHGGVTGKGRVLVCSNYHWLADTGHWNGGLFAYRKRGSQDLDPNEALRPNQALFLNFVAGAVAARADQ